MELGQLRHPVYQESHFLAEHHLYIFQRIFRILHHIVKKGGNNTLGVHFQLCQDIGHCQGMDDVRLTGSTHLGGMGLVRQLIGLLYGLQTLWVFDIGFHLIHEALVFFFLLAAPVLFLLLLLYIFFLMDQELSQSRGGGIGMNGFLIQILVEYPCQIGSLHRPLCQFLILYLFLFVHGFIHFVHLPASCAFYKWKNLINSACRR